MPRWPCLLAPGRAALCGLAGVVLLGLPGPAAGQTPLPWPRTETREPCAEFNPLRNPYFGDLHVHTRWSADAHIYGTTLVGPAEAYDFARGGEVPLADDSEAQTRTARLERRLDFTAVTDHAEFFGEVSLCDTPGSSVYDTENYCQILRQAEPNLNDQGLVIIFWMILAGDPMPRVTSHAFCSLPGVDCDAAAVSVWQEMQAAAEGAYDRTAACTFTSFIGYEHTSSPAGRHLHRNVIFRNEHVPGFAKSHLETWSGGIPQGVWSAVETDCLNAGTGCDAVIIPHNPNFSEGKQWLDPADAAEAQRRQSLEPLAEIHQIKGNSECRFDRLAGLGAGTADELCTFEQDPRAFQGLGQDPTIETYPLRNMIRNTLKDGLRLEAELGVNPFRLGFVGGTDTHDGTAGNVAEEGWEGGQGNSDSSPARQIGEGVRANPGGLTVAWAEENSRDALFEALRRRETYATSGTRPVVRFFGGELADVACGADDFVRTAYVTGTPMGGELGAVRGARSPRFAVWAAKDPGTAASPGTDLQRIQIVKGWVDATGETHERVFDVAGDAANGAGVDPATCAATGAGAADLCTVWTDPAFRRDERAFYYVRVLENPTCRWSTRVCQGAGVDPFASGCATQAQAAGEAFADCCLDRTTDAFLDPVTQERAWTSPIWYRPEGIGRLRASVRFGARPGTDALSVRASLGGVPDVVGDGLVVRVSDDDEIFAVTVQPGTLRRRGRNLVLPREAARAAGVRSLSLTIRGGQALLRLRTRPLDLARAPRADQMVSVSLAAGTYRASQTRLWTLRRNVLGAGGR